MKVDEYLFARWLVLHYDNEYLNLMTGDKWKELYNHYNSVVKPNFKKNSSYKDNIEFMKTPPITREHTKIVEKIVEKKHIPYTSNGCDCGQVWCPTCY